MTNDKTEAWIIDVDGTLAEISHRLAYVQTKPKNWRAFQIGLTGDTPNTQVFDVVNGLRAIGKKIIIVSARQAEMIGDFDVRLETFNWIKENGLSWLEDEDLYMRPAGDFRVDSEVKGDILTELREKGYNIVGVIDDRENVVRYWRSQGIFTFDVNQSGKVY